MGLNKGLLDKKISRRSFLKLSAITGGTLALSGCSDMNDKGDKSGKSDKDRKLPTVDKDVKIVPTAGTNNCGGRCVIKAYVKDDTIIRLGTDTEPDKPEAPQLRACVRGRSYRKTFMHPDRLKYPMKRVGERGEGKFERISWEEAIDIIASETTRIKEEYGPLSRYVNYAWGYSAAIHPMYLVMRLLALDGGYLSHTNDYSAACTNIATPYTYGTTMTGNNIGDVVNSKLIILWGHNPAETIFGTTMYHLRRAKDAGAKIVVIDPRYSDTAIGLADQWIPILPGTDSALATAMAYVMITEDLIDEEFINKYSIGFDEKTMPEGIDSKESYKAYVLGESDGIPKTPEWAESITRAPAKVIEELARDYATMKPAALIQGYGQQRHANGEQSVRSGTILPVLTGNVGISGGWASGAGYVSRINIPSVPVPDTENYASIPCFLWTDAITRGTELTKGDGLEGVEKLPTNIKAIYNLAGNILINQHSDCNKTAELLKDESKVEFIVVSDIFMTPSAKFADILLPGDTAFERDNIATPWEQGDFVIYANKVIEPPFECRNEYYWLAEVADKLGVGKEFREGNETMEDWCKWIVKGIQENHPEFPSYEEFKERGVYKWEFKDSEIAFKEQIEDIENNPFPTPSGKIEIFSKELYEMNNPEEIPAVPKYVSTWEGPEDPLIEKYPLQCIGHHTKRRCHSTHDNNPWGEEVEPQMLWINTKDAEERNIENGDEIKVFNDRGTVLTKAYVTEKIMPGVLSLPQGAWWTPNEEGVDTRGNINTLTKQQPTPLAKGNPQHTNLVEVEKI